MSSLRVALIQLAADHDVSANLSRAAALVRRAGESKPGLIVLPEMFHYRGPVAGFRESASTLPGPLTEPFADLARELNSWLVARQRGRAFGRSDAALQHLRPARPSRARSLPAIARCTSSTWRSTTGRRIGSRPASCPATRPWWPYWRA